MGANGREEANDERSAALPRYMYRDPAEFVRYESELCTGCKCERKDYRTGAAWCVLGDAEGKRRKWGNRCVEFVKRGSE